MVTNIEFEIAPIEEVPEAILDIISKFFLYQEKTEPLGDDIVNMIDGYLEVFKEDLYCLIEYPYVDKVYRDSYYSYYSSKHLTYQRDSIRVSIFSSEIKPEEFLDAQQHDALNGKYLGYFTVRPTLNAIFGRSLVSPSALTNCNFKICRSRQESLVYGAKLYTDGFPHSSQDEETILCAETTVWGLMEYFSAKYSDYKPALPSQIHEVLRSIMIQRQLPSLGLSMDQISFALKEFGFGTRIYNRAPYSSEIYNIIDCYIDSGIPILIGLESSKAGHVVIGIGKEYDYGFDLETVPASDLGSHGRIKKFIEYTNFPKKYVVQDDNMPPYTIIDMADPGVHYDHPDFDGMEVDSIIVPLYPKIYLEAEVARELFLQIVKDEKIGYDFEDGFIFRYFLASSRSFKNHVSLSEMDEGLKYNILSCKMPKFVWCGEIYSAGTRVRDGEYPISLLVLDATEANKTGIDALIFAGYPDNCIRKNENNYVSLQGTFEKYAYYSNLK